MEKKKKNPKATRQDCDQKLLTLLRGKGPGSCTEFVANLFSTIEDCSHLEPDLKPLGQSYSTYIDSHTFVGNSATLRKNNWKEKVTLDTEVASQRAYYHYLYWTEEILNGSLGYPARIRRWWTGVLDTFRK